jgi:hypothetical protein
MELCAILHPLPLSRTTGTERSGVEGRSGIQPMHNLPHSGSAFYEANPRSPSKIFNRSGSSSRYRRCVSVT